MEIAHYRPTKNKRKLQELRLQYRKRMVD